VGADIGEAHVNDSPATCIANLVETSNIAEIAEHVGMQVGEAIRSRPALRNAYANS